MAGARLKRVPGPGWFVYLLRCGDGSLYTGITTDVARRLAEHCGDHGGRRGAKALRGRQPLQIVFSEAVGDRSRAQRLEYRIKQMDKRAKEAIVSGRLALATLETDSTNIPDQ